LKPNAMDSHKFLLDEHVNPRLKAAVHQQDPEILYGALATPVRHHAVHRTQIFHFGVKPKASHW